MKVFSSKALLVISLPVMVFSVAAWSQNSAVLATGGGTTIVSVGPGQVLSREAQNVAPYSATRETETIQTLSDGTHITRKTRMQFYRDSQGRTRQEMFDVNAPEGVPQPVNISIFDPVEGVQYNLNTRNHTAILNRMRPSRPPNPPPPGPAVKPPPPPPQPDPKLRPQNQQEDLGTQMIEGVWSKGTRITTTFPVNAQGNDRPFTTVSEIWFSEELQTNLLTKRSDPRFGETTERLTNIDRSEPDLSLFRPPADYAITEPQRP